MRESNLYKDNYGKVLQVEILLSFIVMHVKGKTLFLWFEWTNTNISDQKLCFLNPQDLSSNENRCY